MALLLLSLGLGLVCAQDFNPQRIVQTNYDISKVGLQSGPSLGVWMPGTCTWGLPPVTGCCLLGSASLPQL